MFVNARRSYELSLNDSKTKAASIIIIQTATNTPLSGPSATIRVRSLWIRSSTTQDETRCHCETVDRWVCRCVHWSKMTGGLWVCCLETEAWQAWQGRPAAPQTDKGPAKPAHDPWLRWGGRLRCLVKLLMTKCFLQYRFTFLWETTIRKDKNSELEAAWTINYISPHLELQGCSDSWGIWILNLFYPVNLTLYGSQTYICVSLLTINTDIQPETEGNSERRGKHDVFMSSDDWCQAQSASLSARSILKVHWLAHRHIFNMWSRWGLNHQGYRMTAVPLSHGAHMCVKTTGKGKGNFKSIVISLRRMYVQFISSYHISYANLTGSGEVFQQIHDGIISTLAFPPQICLQSVLVFRGCMQIGVNSLQSRERWCWTSGCLLNCQKLQVKKNLCTWSA